MEGMGGCNPYSEVCACGVFIYLNLARFFFCQLNMAWYMLYSVRSASGHKSVLHGFEMEIYRHLLHMLLSMVAFSFVVS